MNQFKNQSLHDKTKNNKTSSRHHRDENLSDEHCGARVVDDYDDDDAYDDDSSNNNSNNNDDDDSDDYNDNISGDEGEDQGYHWFGSSKMFRSEFQSIANCFKDSTLPVFGGMADFVHKTAMTVATEIAMLDEEVGTATDPGTARLENEKTTSCNDENKNHAHEQQEQQQQRRREMYQRDPRNVSNAWSSHSSTNPHFKDSNIIQKEQEAMAPLSLPWEVELHHQQNDHEPTCYVTDSKLMELILSLGLDDSIFFKQSATPTTTTTRSSSSSSSAMPTPTKVQTPTQAFVLDKARVHLIERILDIDNRLVNVHTRLCKKQNKLSEIEFWKIYFERCDEVRQKYFTRKTCNPPAGTDFKVKKSESSSSLACFHDNDVVNCESNNDNSLRNASENENERSSIDAGDDDDDVSYVIYPSPMSGETFASTKTLEDLVLVHPNAGLLQ